MSNIRGALLGRFPGLESDVNADGDDDLEIQAPEEGVDATGAQTDGENIVEGDLVEAAEETREVDSANAEAGELEDTADSLESFLLAAQLGQRQGGWSGREALAYSVGLDATLKRLGADHSAVVPSLESFTGSERQRIDACVSVENKIKDALISIWEAIKRAVNKVMAFIKKWWVKIFDGASRLKKRAEAIRKKAENTSGTAKEKKFTTSTYANLHVSKAMPNSTAIKTALDGIATTIKELTAGRTDSGYGQLVDDVVDNVQKFADADGSGSINEAADTLSGSCKKYAGQMTLTFVKGASASEDDRKRFYGSIASAVVVPQFSKTGELPGGKVLWVLTAVAPDVKGNDNGQLGRNLAAAFRVSGRVSLADYSPKKVEIDNSKEVPVLEIGGVIEICDGVIDMCQPIIDYKLGFANYEKKNSAALGKVDAVLRKANNGKTEDKTARERAELTRGLAQAVGSIIRNRGTSITNVVNYGVSLGRNALVYSVQSLAQYRD